MRMCRETALEKLKRSAIRILLGAPQTVDVLRAVGGFSLCLVLFEKLPLRGLCQMGRGAGFLLCVYCFFFGHQTNYHKFYHNNIRSTLDFS